MAGRSFITLVPEIQWHLWKNDDSLFLFFG